MEKTFLTKLKQLFLLTATGVLILSCEKDTGQTQNNDLEKIQVNKQSNQMSANDKGATQISGSSVYAGTGECQDAAGAGATYALKMSGDLVGCFYVFVEESNCSPSGTYLETGREVFVGTYNGQPGTFSTNYRFEGKYEGCVNGTTPVGAEIMGRCQHPIAEGSGTGVFEGVKGRLDMKDDVDLLIFAFKGHLRY